LFVSFSAGFLVLLFLFAWEAEGGRRASVPHQVAHVKRVLGKSFGLFHGGERMNQSKQPVNLFLATNLRDTSFGAILFG
jgi:hypothetical protein